MPKSDPPNRPAEPKPPPKPTAPKPDVAIHGWQWGSSGKQGAIDPDKADRLEPEQPPRKQS